jgi:hypothetical protein
VTMKAVFLHTITINTLHETTVPHIPLYRFYKHTCTDITPFSFSLPNEKIYIFRSDIKNGISTFDSREHPACTKLVTSQYFLFIFAII